MSVRRPFARYNRGRVLVPRAAVAAAPGVVVPLAGTWDGCYCDAADGPVDVGSGKIHPWVALEGNNLEQASSGDRGTLTTLYYGGENAVLFNGTNERMLSAAVATVAAGTGVSFTMAFDVHIVSFGANDSVAAMGNNSAVDGPYQILRTNASTGADWQIARDADTGGALTREGGTVSTGVHRLIYSYDGATHLGTVWDNGTKIMDGVSLASSGVFSFTNFAIACRIIASAGNFLNGAYRRVAVRSGTTSDADAATLDTAWS